jgi:outer membrane immunogenic protein
MTYTAPYQAKTGTVGYTNRNSQDIDMALVRLNYKFGGPILAKY